MASPLNNNPEEDLHPDQIAQATWAGILGQLGTSTMAGNASSLFARPLQSTNFKPGEQGWRLNSNGIAEFTGLIIKDSLYTVLENQNIQTAIDEISARGGGTVQLTSGTYTLTSNLTIPSGVRLVGSGIENTILEFSGASYGVVIEGTASTDVTNVGVSEMTIQNSNNQGGLMLDYVSYFAIKNVRITSCDKDGLYIEHSTNGLISSSIFDNNTDDGLEIILNTTPGCSDIRIENCVAHTNTDDGFIVESNYTTLFNCRSYSNGGIGFYTYNSVASSLLSCVATDNGGDGFNSSALYLRIANCFAKDNTGDGFDISGQGAAITGNTSYSNSAQGFEISGYGSAIVGNAANLNSSTDFYISADQSTVVGNASSSNLSTTETPVSIGLITTTSNSSRMFGNFWDSPITLRDDQRMKNVSGGSLTEGQVVVISPATDSDEVTTTTTQGDDLVFGVVGTTISNNEYGEVRVLGDTIYLKVDGTTDIAVGDFLATSTTAGIAMKASAGDMAFAIANEAYTTDDTSGVIDATIIKPRKI